MDLTGKNAIVSGGSLGIGSSISLELGRAGANVALNYRKHGDEAEAIVHHAMELLGRRCRMVTLAGVEIRQFGHVHVVVGLVTD